MARTKKSRGGDPFKLRSGNSPKKFLGGLVGKAIGGLGRAALGGIGNALGGSRLFGGRRRSAASNMSASNASSMMGGPMMGMGPLTKKRSKTDKNTINTLKNELMAMKDPMESNRGKNIVKKLRALGADPENFM
jgi:hypothetical protein